MEIKIKTFLCILIFFSSSCLYAQSWLDKAKEDVRMPVGSVNGKTPDEIKKILLEAQNGNAAAQFEIYKIAHAKNKKGLAKEWLQKAIAQNYIPALRASDNFWDILKAAETGDSASLRRMEYKLFGYLMPPPKTPPTEQFKAAEAHLEKFAQRTRGGKLAGHLAFMYLAGKDGVKDSIKGMKWMTLSASWGNKRAQEYLFTHRKGVTSISKDENIDIDIPETSIQNANTFVLIFANENYSEGFSVLHALNDGRVFRIYCTKTLGIPQKNIHLIENATFNDMKQNLQWTRDIIEAFDNKVNILIYYAGQGYIGNKEGKKTMLIPSDGKTDDASSLYSLDDLYSNIKNCSQGIVLIDANFNGADRSGRLKENSRGVAIKQSLNTPKGNILSITAANTGNGETAYMYDTKQHGMFTYYLLKEIQHTRGNIDWGTLFNSVKEKVNISALKLNQHGQNPRAYSDIPQTVWQKWPLIPK